MWWVLEYLQWSCIRTFVNISLYVRRSPWMSPHTQPDQIKTYPCRPYLFACRIFLPRNHIKENESRPADDGTRALPLVVRAHGGGFMVNNPAADDPIARHLADHAECVVVSIDYGKAPQNKFPVGYEDVVALSLAVIDDEDLPTDRSKVVLCGSSAGGNLVLAATQDPRLREKVVGVVGIYPPVDVAEDGPAKMARRPDPAVPDFIGDSYAGIQGLYLDGTDKPSLKDPRLSPTYFTTRESLPPNVLLIGAEHDMFCHEDELMADKIAGLSGGAKTKSSGGWRTPGVRWHKIHGQAHAFDAFAAKTPEQEAARVAAVEEMYLVITQWLVHIFSVENAL